MFYRKLAGMIAIPHQQLRPLATQLFAAAGAPLSEAGIVADHLVEASLRGLDSHGIIRVLFYLDEIAKGRLKPNAPVTVERDRPTTAVVDAHGNFGQVCGVRMVEVAAAKARATGLSCVISKHSHHVGRLGAYTEALAAQGFVALGTVCSHKPGHYVAPWGGREGRLATNPISWAAPTSRAPLVLDMSTSMIAEGKIRALMHAGEDLPPDCVLDAAGKLTRDPQAFYGPPRGTILPFGGAMGYKGFGLSLLTMVLGEAMAGEEIADDSPYINGLALVTIDPAAFEERAGFLARMDRMVAYLKATPPAAGAREVLLPGEFELRTRETRLRTGIPISPATWEQLQARAQQLGVAA